MVLLGQAQSFRDVADDDGRALRVRQFVVRVEARLVLREIDRVLHLSDVMVERPRTHQLRLGPNLVGYLRSQVAHGDGGGDAGTGKSSAVKAIANEFAPEGLRLVEVKKNQLYQIPDLMDKLAANPLKFILFIDDLSFTANDDNFAALKAILEGSVGGRAKNIAVYATSNRRHLIKETLTDRTGDDIHEADTRQELMSLSARFGLTVTFQRPEKARFENILAELAKQHGIDMPMDQLLVKAEAFAIRAGGRSPRVAKQFIEQCEAGVQK